MSAKPLCFDEAEEAMASLLAWFEDPKFPEVALPDLFNVQVVAAESGVGATEYVTTVVWTTTDAEPEWLFLQGATASILARNEGGAWPRRVDTLCKNVSTQEARAKPLVLSIGNVAMPVRDLDQPDTKSHLVMSLVVHTFAMRVLESTGMETVK